MKLFYKNQLVGVINNGLVCHGKILRIKRRNDEHMNYIYDVKLLYHNKEKNVQMWDLGGNLCSTVETMEDIIIYPCFKKALLNCLSYFENFRIEANRSDDGPVPQMDDRDYSRGMMCFATYHYQIKKLRMNEK